MRRLWNYEDYIRFLSHDNSFVREWAFDALEKKYPNRYTDEVSKLISDQNSHLACAAPKYLAIHKAVQHAPAILNSFLHDSGNIPSNCAQALARMKYEPALDTIIEYLSNEPNTDPLFGIIDYLGNIDDNRAREILISVVTQTKDPVLKGDAIYNLLKHEHQDDIAWISDIILQSVKKGDHLEQTGIDRFGKYWDAGYYFRELTDKFSYKSIILDPAEAFDSFFNKNDHLSVTQELKEEIALLLKKRQYQDLITALLLDARNMIQKRYPQDVVPDEVLHLFNMDSAGIFLFETLSEQPSLWPKLKAPKNYETLSSLVSFVLSVYFSIVERNAYTKALMPDAQITDLIRAIQNSGPRVPEALSQKIVNLAPVSELKATLSETLNTWCDINIVNIMGRIGKKEFVPDLIRVLNETDGLDIIYGDAISALNAIDESADQLILNAAQNNDIKDWDLTSILEYLPYPESFDLIMEKWNDKASEVDSYEMFAYCLRGIGDPRGISVLQQIYNNENNAGYIGEILECLSILNNTDIPELPKIRKKREQDEKQQGLREQELNDMFNSMENIRKAIPFQRDTQKIGRNDPCPCGSGKKYKKCCLNNS
nr:HEAT repeat domain-containing protein [uncultured Desulfobacter sp.]